MFHLTSNALENAKGVAHAAVTLPNGDDIVGICFMLDPTCDRQIAEEMERNRAVVRGMIVLDPEGDYCSLLNGWDLIQSQRGQLGIQLWGASALDPKDKMLCYEVIEQYLFQLGVIE